MLHSILTTRRACAEHAASIIRLAATSRSFQRIMSSPILAPSADGKPIILRKSRDE
jgi:hypothetical protein